MDPFEAYYLMLLEIQNSINAQRKEQEEKLEGCSKSFSCPSGTSSINSEDDKLDDNPTAFIEWSPLDDEIDCVFPHDDAAASTDMPPSREEVEAFIMKVVAGSAQSAAVADDDNHPNTLDSKIDCVLPAAHVSTDKISAREARDREFDARIIKRSTRPDPKRRLPVFAEICPDDHDNDE